MSTRSLRAGSVSALFALLVLSGAPRAAPAWPVCTPPMADWTILLLLNADAYANQDAHLMEELATVPWNGSVRLLALVDQYASNPVPLFGQPAQCGGMIYLSEGGQLKPLACLVGDPTPNGGPPDPNLGDPSYLKLLFELGQRWAPAHNVCLWVEGHGEGWVGLSHDSSHDGASDNVLSLAELAHVLAEAPAPACEKAVDLLVLDTCTSACAEMLARVGPHVPWIVASEGFIDIDGLQQDLVLGELVAHPSMTPEQLGRRLVATYQKPTATACDAQRDYGVMSLLRTASCNAWTQRAKDLLDLATDMWTVAPATHEVAVREACVDAQPIACDSMGLACHVFGDVDCCMHDVQGAAELITGLADPALQQAALNLSSACGDIVRCRSAGYDAQDLSGFSFFYPCQLADITPYVVEPMAVATGWGPFLMRQTGDGCAEEPQDFMGPVTVVQGEGAWRVEAPMALAPEAVESAYLMICLPESHETCFAQAIPVGQVGGSAGFSARWDGRVVCAGTAGEGIPLAHSMPSSPAASPQVIATSELRWQSAHAGGEVAVRARIVYTSGTDGIQGRVASLQSTGRERLGVFLWPWRVGDRLRLDPNSELARWWRSGRGSAKDDDLGAPVTAIPLPCVARYLHAEVPALAALRVKLKGKAARTFFADKPLTAPWRPQ